MILKCSHDFLSVIGSSRRGNDLEGLQSKCVGIDREALKKYEMNVRSWQIEELWSKTIDWKTAFLSKSEDPEICQDFYETCMLRPHLTVKKRSRRPFSYLWGNQSTDSGSTSHIVTPHNKIHRKSYQKRIQMNHMWSRISSNIISDISLMPDVYKMFIFKYFLKVYPTYCNYRQRAL